ncbi:GntR family transcriptional regulator [Fodinicurvata sp. EGI_FJ10296]|uniref:GntR family transcriptional regulator n=1 Tax=Fodinicurvata sp. EGI_FJ10296 TaxID=3231908 RepID=UPI0034531419
MPTNAAKGKISRQSLGKQAVDHLRGQILSGHLASGERLVETAIAEEVGLSRSTIRGALAELAHEGLVTQVAYTKWMVSELTAEAAWDLYTLRSALEGLAVRLAASQVTAEHIERIRKAQRNLEKAARKDDKAALAEADFALHELLIELSGNAQLMKHYRLIEQQVRLLIASSNSLIAAAADVVAQHKPIVDAICAGDEDAAEALMREHSLGEGRRLVDHIRATTSDGHPPHPTEEAVTRSRVTNGT